MAQPRASAVPQPRGRRRGLSVWTVFAIALESLVRTKTRTILATLGIIIGVGCVIAMMGLAEGTRREMEAQIRRLGSNLLSIRPAAQRQGAVNLGAETRQSLKLEDAGAIAEHCTHVVRVAPRLSEGAQIKYRNQNTRSSVFGITPEYLQIRNFKIAEGRVFKPGEVSSRARVCVLGPAAREELFGTRKALGERLQIQGQSFRVIGLLRPSNPDWDDNIWVPVTTAMYRLFNLDSVEGIEVEARDEKSLDAAMQEIETLLRRRHRLRPGQDNDFQIYNQQDRLETASETSRVLTVLLAGIASVSLLVGGIGIMNIMLVSVTERTREIGIRRAIGARGQDILWQFLVEALVMCGLGALLGVGLGLTACWLGATYAGWPVSVTASSVALSCGFAIAIGTFFGFYPAFRAARLSPLTALRYD